MQFALSLGLGFYLFVYAFEAPIRWGLSMGGADDLIFLRDAALGVPLLGLLVQQWLARKVHPAYIVFIVLLVLHGTVSLLNIRSPFVVLYSAKMCLGLLAGAVASGWLFQPSRGILLYLAALWTATAAGVILDKYFVEFPWVGSTTIIGGLEVDISRDWEITGADKRAGGFMRSSINVAFFEALVSYVLLFNIRRVVPCVAIALVTLFTLYCTTQKGAILAYAAMLGLLMLSRKRPLPLLKGGVLFFMLACILLPLTLPHYLMPSTTGVFSFASFYDRVDNTWPQAWAWIDRMQVFPMGIGLGGIGGAQRFYSNDDLNYADNLFILLYAFCGMMTFVYLGWIATKVIQFSRDTSRSGMQALMVLGFLFGYGCVLSIVEDQMGALFFGAALGAIGHETLAQRVVSGPKISPLPAGEVDRPERSEGGRVRGLQRWE